MLIQHNRKVTERNERRGGRRVDVKINQNLAAHVMNCHHHTPRHRAPAAGPLPASIFSNAPATGL